MTTTKLVGHGLSKSLRDLVQERVPVSAVLHIESSALLADPNQIRNFVHFLSLEGLNDRAYDISLALWEADRLIFNGKADAIAKAKGIWRPATEREITQNEPSSASMRRGRVPPKIKRRKLVAAAS